MEGVESRSEYKCYLLFDSNIHSNNMRGKGSQGGKRSMDRASGSGVFARDPDAMLDLIELDVTDDLRKQEQNKTVCATCQTYLDSHFGWEDDLSQDDLCTAMWNPFTTIMQRRCLVIPSGMQWKRGFRG